jgi:hypothetical protein
VAVSSGVFCVRCPIRYCTCIISTAASVSPSVIVQIGLTNMQMCAITYAIKRQKQFGGGEIMDRITDPSAFSRITDGITETEAKNAGGNGPYVISKVRFFQNLSGATPLAVASSRGHLGAVLTYRKFLVLM